MLKYKRRNDNIYWDYYHYLEEEGIYPIVYGHETKAGAKKKAKYIWNALMKQY